MTQVRTLMTAITLYERIESNAVTDRKGSHATSISSKGFAVPQLA